MTASRNLILDRVVVLLETITTGNGYSVTVADVSRDSRLIFEVPIDQFPMIDVVGGKGTFEYDPVGVVHHTFEFVVVGSVKGTNLTGIENFMADIKNAIATWETDTTMRGYDVEEILPFDEDTDQGTWPDSTCAIAFRCTYEHAYGSA